MTKERQSIEQYRAVMSLLGILNDRLLSGRYLSQEDHDALRLAALAGDESSFEKALAQAEAGAVNGAPVGRSTTGAASSTVPSIEEVNMDEAKVSLLCPIIMDCVFIHVSLCAGLFFKRRCGFVRAGEQSCGCKWKQPCPASTDQPIAGEYTCTLIIGIRCFDTCLLVAGHHSGRRDQACSSGQLFPCRQRCCHRVRNKPAGEGQEQLPR